MGIKEKIKEILVGNMDEVRNVNIDDNTHVINDLYYDSITFISLIINLENEFDIVLDEEKINIDDLLTYKDICDCISKCIEKQKTSR